MSHPTETERTQAIQKMFSTIARRYDVMNRLMTGGQDVFWRREVIRHANLPPGGLLLDVGAGTGDLGNEALRQYPNSQVVAGDFTLDMMRAGKERSGKLLWTAADALYLPFPSEKFDAVVSGFLLRNVSDVPQALREHYRVLKPGGKLVTLDTTRPTPNLFSPLIRLYMRRVIPATGWLLTGQRPAYAYLTASTEGFLPAEELAEKIAACGFQNVGFRRQMFGTIAIHWAEKPPA